MSLSDHKITSWTQDVSSMPDRPSASGWTSSQVKAGFDSNSNQLKDAINGLIDDLEPAIEGDQAVFIAVYGETESADIEAAYQAGNVVLVKNGIQFGIMDLRNSATSHHFIVTHGNTYYNLICDSDTWSASSLQTLASIASPNFIGTPTAPTASSGTNTTQLATTAFVQTAISSKAPLASPALTGTPTAPTASSGTNTTQIATTAFVNAAVNNIDNIYIADYADADGAEIMAAHESGKALFLHLPPTETLWFGTTQEMIMSLYGIWGNGSPSYSIYFGAVDTTGMWSVYITYDTSDDTTFKDYPIRYDFVGTSGGTMTGALTLSGAPTQNLHAATKKYVDDGLSAKQNTLTFDDSPTEDSANPVKSGGVYTALEGKQDAVSASGILKGDGDGGITAATAGTDYQAPLTAGTDYQTPLVAGTDYQTPLTAGTDYQIPLVAGTDYQTPLPSQTGNSGKFLTTDGTNMSWAAAGGGGGGAGLPDQTGKSGKFLTTNGTDASWGDIPSDSTKQAKITANGLLKGDGNGGVSAAVSGTDYQAPLTAGTDYQTPLVAGTDYQTPLPSQSGNSGKFLTTDGSAMSWAAVTASGVGALPISGGTLTGALVLAGAPTADLNPASKKYVDDICGDIETALTTINTALGGLI